MDSAELDMNNTLLTSSSLTTTTSNPDDYEKDLRLAAELGRCLLERNNELQNYINILQKQLDDKQCDMKVKRKKKKKTTMFVFLVITYKTFFNSRRTWCKM